MAYAQTGWNVLEEFTGTLNEADVFIFRNSQNTGPGPYSGPAGTQERLPWPVLKLNLKDYFDTLYGAETFDEAAFSTKIGAAYDTEAELQALFAAKVANSLFDAHTIIYATTDDTPAALTVTEQTVVGRITGGNIAALTPAQIRTLTNLEILSDCSGITAGMCLDSDDGLLYAWNGVDAVELIGSSAYAPIASPTFTGTVTLPATVTLPNAGKLRLVSLTDEHEFCIQATNDGESYVDVVCFVADTGGAPEMQLPAGAKFTGLGASNLKITELTSDDLSDTSTPHALTAAEVSGTLLTNYDSSAEAKEYDLPAAASGYNFVFRLILDQNVTLDPNGTEVMYLNGTAMAAGEAIVNTSRAVGQSITCMTHKTGAATWQWFCDSADAEFLEESPPE
jgi:hypothetical protein